jgi:hypothetical protein
LRLTPPRTPSTVAFVIEVFATADADNGRVVVEVASAANAEHRGVVVEILAAAFTTATNRA